MSTYLIAPSTNPPFDAMKFHNFVTTQMYSTYVSGWWYRLGGNVYMVKTDLNSNQISQLVRGHMNGLYFIVIKVDPTDAQGWLPSEAWEWLNSS